MTNKQLFAFHIFRVIVCLMLFIHGSTRLLLWEEGIPQFGQYLDEKGFLFGNLIAGAITLLEIVGAILIASGKYVKWLSLFFITYLIMGIIMVHFQNGWFVVGHSLNGVEYNVLLINCMVFIWAQQHFMLGSKMEDKK